MAVPRSLLRRLRKFRVWYALVAERLAAFAEIGVDLFLRRRKFGLRLLAASEAREHLATDEVHALVIGREAQRRVDRRQRFAIFFLLHVNFCQTEERSGHLGIALQSFAEEALRFFIVSRTLIKLRELLVRIGQVGLDSQVLAKFRLGFFQVLEPQIGNS